MPAFSVGSVSNPDDTPVNPGVYVGVPSGTQPEKFLGYAPLYITCIAAGEAAAFALFQAVSAKFSNQGPDRAHGFSVDPRGPLYGLRLSRVKVDKEEAPLMLTTSTPDLFQAVVHLSVWGSTSA